MHVVSKGLPGVSVKASQPESAGLQRVVDALNDFMRECPQQNMLRAQNSGALLFWEVFQQLWARYEKLEVELLERSRGEHILRLRLDALEKIASEQREALHRYDRRMKFYCLSCANTFELPLEEAAILGFASLCPHCHSWALPGAANPTELLPLVDGEPA